MRKITLCTSLYPLLNIQDQQSEEVRQNDYLNFLDLFRASICKIECKRILIIRGSVVLLNVSQDFNIITFDKVNCNTLQTSNSHFQRQCPDQPREREREREKEKNICQQTSQQEMNNTIRKMETREYETIKMHKYFCSKLQNQA